VNLKGRTAIVTGASSGIGRETVKAFDARGATVFAVARREELLNELAKEHDNVVPVPADVTIEEDRERIASVAGEVDVLVNNAGRGWLGLVEQMPAADIRELFELNVLASIDLTQRVLPGMLERRRGHIVMVSSVAAYVSLPPLTVYSATKHAIQGFSDGLRRELLGRGVHVSTVNPGLVRTEFVEAAPGGDTPVVERAFNASAMPASMVVNAILQAVQFDGLPGFTEIAVPRVNGLTRLANLPGVSTLVDLASVPARMFGRRLQ
jgi:short-subunit dehydrogenase